MGIKRTIRFSRAEMHEIFTGKDSHARDELLDFLRMLQGDAQLGGKVKILVNKLLSGSELCVNDWQYLDQMIEISAQKTDIPMGDTDTGNDQAKADGHGCGGQAQGD